MEAYVIWMLGWWHGAGLHIPQHENIALHIKSQQLQVNYCFDLHSLRCIAFCYFEHCIPDCLLQFDFSTDSTIEQYLSV